MAVAKPNEVARESGPALQKFDNIVCLGPKTYTASGTIRPSGIVLLNNTNKIEMTLEAPLGAGQLLVITQIDTGTAGHTVTVPSGVTWDGTNDVATLNAQGETLTVISTSATRWMVMANPDSISFS